MISFCDAISCSENPFETIILDMCLASATITKPKKVASALVNMCDDCPSLKALSLAGTFNATSSSNSKSLFLTLTLFLQLLEAQKSLLELDIGNQKMGDALAFAIGKLLRTNDTLASIHCENNHFTESGYRIIRASLFDNTSLQFFSFPWDDLQSHRKRSTSSGTTPNGGSSSDLQLLIPGRDGSGGSSGSSLSKDSAKQKRRSTKDIHSLVVPEFARSGCVSSPTALQNCLLDIYAAVSHPFTV